MPATLHRLPSPPEKRWKSLSRNDSSTGSSGSENALRPTLFLKRRFSMSEKFHQPFVTVDLFPKEHFVPVLFRRISRVTRLHYLLRNITYQKCPDFFSLSNQGVIAPSLKSQICEPLHHAQHKSYFERILNGQTPFPSLHSWPHKKARPLQAGLSRFIQTPRIKESAPLYSNLSRWSSARP